MSKIKKLTELVKYAKTNNEFYAELYSNVEENNFELEELPILKRAHIKDNSLRIISKEYCVDELKMESTYGTTEGIPLKIYKSSSERINLGRLLWKCRRSLNDVACKRYAYYYYNTDNPQAVPQVGCEKDRVAIDFPVIKQSEKEYIKDLHMMKEYSIKWLICPPTIAFKISQIAEKYNVVPELEMIEFLSEYVPSFYQENIKRVFKCDTCIEYGCHEIWGIAFTRRDNVLKIMDNIIIEKLQDNRFLNGYGRCLVTNLKLKSMPFIRYELNDLIYIKGEELRTYGFRSSDAMKICNIEIHCSFFSNIFESDIECKIFPLEDYQIIYNDKVICLGLCNIKPEHMEILGKYLKTKLLEYYKLNVEVQTKTISRFLTDDFTGKMKGIIKYENIDIL